MDELSQSTLSNNFESISYIETLLNLDIDDQIKWLNTNFNQLMEPQLIDYFDTLIEKSSDSKLALKYVELGQKIIELINPFLWDKIANKLYNGFTSIKWQTKTFCLNLISAYAIAHPIVIAQNMPKIIENLIIIASDIKKEVKLQAEKTFTDVASTIDNVDIKNLIPIIISAYVKPTENTQKALDALVATAFVNDVDIPTLGFLVPLLIKSMRERKMVYQRRAAVVIETLCKLLKNPIYARQFYSVLEPVLTRGSEEIAEVEIRNVCLNSKAVLTKVYEQGNDKHLEAYKLDDCIAQYKQILSENNVDQNNQNNQINQINQINLTHPIITHSIDLIFNLIQHENVNDETWIKCIKPYLAFIIKDDILLDTITEQIKSTIIKVIQLNEYDPEDNEENLCDCMFSLAYGTRVLLHQTPFKIKVARKYAILGSNGAGKSTLMRAIANKSLAEFPNIDATFVEHHIPEEKQEMITLDYILADEKIRMKRITREQVINDLAEVNVSEHMMNAPLYTLSGGNVQRVNLILAKLRDDPLLLLDEPTNHIDLKTIGWLKTYIKNLKTTCLIISHDIKFLDDVCTNVIHYENLKLKTYHGNITEFVKHKPEAKFYFETSSQDILSFSFPEPGPLDGVKSLTKAVLKMKDCYFQYPSTPKPQLSNVSIQVSMASRVVICGVNGSGKTTLVKLLVNEIEQDQGIIEKHPNLRLAYIPQNVTSILKGHEDKSPVEYIMWRYRLGADCLQTEKKALKMSDEEIEEIKRIAKDNKTFVIKELVARKTGKREHEYEAKADGMLELTKTFTKSELIEMGYEKMVKEFDQKLAMDSMAGQKKLTTGEIQKHLDNFGLTPDIAQYTKMSALSSGQKHKIALGSIFWHNPHIAIFDEPTNFLDKESTSALSDAIKNFKGGVLVISHNEDFYNAITREKWLLEAGHMTIFGDDMIEALEKERKKQEKENAKKLNFDQAEDKFDSLGNKIEVKKEVKELDRNEKKRLMKLKKDMEKRGEDTYEVDVILGLA
jgi:elongation factor 3